MLPTLYLFYNANLLEICERPGTATSAIGFIDNVNILAYGTSTEGNIKTLERLHINCEAWARRHGSKFAPKKYKLIHFARNPKRFNMAAPITIAGEVNQPKADIRVLGVQLDTKLKLGPHVKKIQAKMTTQTQALTKLTAPTWGATFMRARHVYSAVVRPAINYGSTVWHSPAGTKDAKKDTVGKFAVIQNKCLRVIAGAFRAIPVEVLHAETMMPPVQLHLDQL